MTRPVLLLLKETKGDLNFHRRWSQFGPVYRGSISKEAKQIIEIMVIDHRVTIDDEVLKKYPKLKWIVSPNTAHTHIDIKNSPHIKIISLKGETNFLTEISSVSEFVFKTLLEYLRPSFGGGSVLRGKQIGVVGLGRIGKQVSKISEGFQMIVSSIDKDSLPEQWETLFKSCDIITVHLPESPDTHQIVSRKYIDMMKTGSIFINTARPSVVDEVALSDALISRRIGYAMLDVVDNHELFKGENVKYSYHQAGDTLEDRSRTDEFVCEKLAKELNREHHKTQ